MAAPVSLLCLPCAGASATMYLRWRRLLPQWIRIVPLELPGRGHAIAQRFVENFDELVVQLCSAQSRELTGRYALFGHSMGALLAYGMAAHLRDLGRALPQSLLVSGSAAPSRRSARRLAGKNDDQALIADLRRHGGTPDEVFDSPELMRIALDTLGADYRICESFHYAGSAPLPCAVHAFGGRQDEIDAAALQAWSEQAGSRFTLDWFDGGHFFIQQQEDAMLAAIVQCLAQTHANALHADGAIE